MARFRVLSVLGLAAVVSTATAGSAAIEDGADRIRMVPAAAIGDFELTNQDGRPQHFSELRGRNALIFFGFTHCPDICPTTLYKLKLVHDSQRSNGKPAPAVVLISVDGDRDTPEVMKTYLAPLSEGFIGLTGDPRAVRGIAATFSAVFFKGLPADGSGAYMVDHTSQVYLVDAKGRLRAVFSDASVEQMSQVTQSITAN